MLYFLKVIGYYETLQRRSNLGKRNNQQFINLPLGNIKEKLEYLCKLYGIRFVKQEESYTSKASFFDRGFLPSYHADKPQECIFSGTRIKRGFYKHSYGVINADVNGDFLNRFLGILEAPASNARQGGKWRVIHGSIASYLLLKK